MGPRGTKCCGYLKADGTRDGPSMTEFSQQKWYSRQRKKSERTEEIQELVKHKNIMDSEKKCVTYPFRNQKCEKKIITKNFRRKKGAN